MSSQVEPLNLIDDFWEAGLSHTKLEEGFLVNRDELAKGIEVEMEHTTDGRIARKIALDHLAEFPDYYTELLKMESPSIMIIFS